MSEDTTTSRKGFWGFCDEHPLAAVIAVIFIMAGTVGVIEVVGGHQQPDEGWWTATLNVEQGRQ